MLSNSHIITAIVLISAGNKQLTESFSLNAATPKLLTLGGGTPVPMTRYSPSTAFVGTRNSRTITSAPRKFAMAATPGEAISAYVENLASVPEHEVPWAICLILSLVYIYSIFESDIDRESCLTEGFCISGYCDSKQTNTEKTDSHALSFQVDTVFTAIAILLPAIDKLLDGKLKLPYFDGTPQDAYRPENLLSIAIGLPVIILAHGILHKYLSGQLEEGKEPTTPTNNIAFIIFSLVLVSVNILGFSTVPEHSTGAEIAGIISVVTGIIYFVTMNLAEKVGISGFFGSTQLLVTGTAALAANNKADFLMAYTFIPVCLLSLVEFYSCGSDSVFKRKGGHVWYDAALHISVLTGFWTLENNINQPQQILDAFSR